MKTNDNEFAKVQARSCGGWIGVFDDGSLRFGVTADTEDSVRAELDVALLRWRAGGADDWVREV